MDASRLLLVPDVTMSTCLTGWVPLWEAGGKGRAISWEKGVHS